MEQEAKSTPCSSRSSFGLWLAIGVAMGLIIFKNLILGIGVGVALGLTVGKGISCCGSRRDPDSLGEPQDSVGQEPSDGYAKPSGYEEPNELGSPEDYADPEDR